MKNDMPSNYIFESGPMGAIGEYASLMLRVNRNCPWNRCLFCPVYKNERFSSRSVEELKQDIDAVRRTYDLIMNMAAHCGLTSELLYEVIGRNPQVYGAVGTQPSPEQQTARGCLSRTANWIFNGARRVFLQDADALAMKISDLVEVLDYLKHAFPTIDTITCYARSKSCARRSVEELIALKNAGLNWCFIGVESGCDAVLEYMKKGVTSREHIEAGRKLSLAGINVAAFVMPGLAGYRQSRAKTHIADTVFVLNEMQPKEIRVRSLAVLQQAPLYRLWKSGEFIAPTEDSLVEEMRELLEGIKVKCTIETLQMTNPVISLQGPIGVKRKSALKQLDAYQALTPNRRARFNLQRYCEGGYIRYAEDCGYLSEELERLIDEAYSGIEEDAPDAPDLVEKALFALKSTGIP
ncbi:MAG: radical SAM protein [Syntrophaceae bacterium]|nr:radical SAM protein [Syntrophaceae bacterium]